jgi:hypothetical protein
MTNKEIFKRIVSGQASIEEVEVLSIFNDIEVKQSKCLVVNGEEICSPGEQSLNERESSIIKSLGIKESR